MKAPPKFDWAEDLRVALRAREMMHHVVHFLIGLGAAELLRLGGMPAPGQLICVGLLAAGKEWLDALWAGMHARPICVFDSIFDFLGWMLAWTAVQAR